MNHMIAIDTVSWTLIHFLWQGTLVAALLALLLPQFRSAKARYAASTTALLLLPALSWGSFAYEWSHSSNAHRHGSTLATRTAIDTQAAAIPKNHNDDIARPNAKIQGDPTPSLSGVESKQAPTPLAQVAVPPRGESNSSVEGLAWRLSQDWQFWLVMAWMMGVATLSLRFFVHWRAVGRIRQSATATAANSVWSQRLKLLATRISASHRVRLFTSPMVAVPMVMGVLRPIVVAPVSMLSSLTPDQVDAILLHELAHVRRHDFLVNLMQSLIETVFFFHPGVWWISGKMRLHREFCCDDMASAACENRTQYAWALTALEEIRGDGKEPTLAQAASGRDGSLIHRIQRLVGGESVDNRCASLLPMFSMLPFAALLLVGSLWTLDSLSQAAPPISPQPPQPKKVEMPADKSHAGAKRDHDHPHPDGESEAARVRAVIGRYDPDYWRDVDTKQLLRERHAAFSPSGNWLALLRSSQLLVIESRTGIVDQQHMLDKTKNASLQWPSEERINVEQEGVENLTSFPVERRGLKVVGPNSSLVKSHNGVTIAQVGFPWPQRPEQPDRAKRWSASPDRNGLVSLAGLGAGTHWLVVTPDFPNRNIVRLTMPTQREVVEVPVRPIDLWRSTNLSFKATATKSHQIQIRIENRTGQLIRVSEKDVRLEVGSDDQPESNWAMSPEWRFPEKQGAITSIYPNQDGVLTISWPNWVSNGLWYDHQGLVNHGGPALPTTKLGEAAVRVWIRNHGVLPIILPHPSLTARTVRTVLSPPPNPSATAAALERARAAEMKVVRDYVMLRLEKHILRRGKIPTDTINTAIEVVAADGGQFPEVRQRLIEELERRMADKRQHGDVRVPMKLARAILGRDGDAKWTREYYARNPSSQAQVLPPAPPADAKTPLLDKVLALGYMADRSDIDAYVLAIRAAHHPKTVPFLLDVLRNPMDTGSPFAGAPRPPANSKWRDHIGGTWEVAQFHAAVGLAELGNHEGVEWLLRNAKPNDFGLNADRRKQCEFALAALSKLPVAGGYEPWVEWWKKTRENFIPLQVNLEIPHSF